MTFPLPRKHAEITEEQSAEVKAALDTITSDAVREKIARDYPLEWDEWHEEVERGDRPWSVNR